MAGVDGGGQALDELAVRAPVGGGFATSADDHVVRAQRVLTAR
ncbi:hypothetical protein [Streptomyces microflavus]